MPSNFTKSSIVLAALVVLLIGAPAIAQSQSSGGSDPFSGVPAVDSDQMSAVSGDLAGGISAGVSTHIESGDCGTGAQCAGGLHDIAIGATTRDVSARAFSDLTES